MGWKQVLKKKKKKKSIEMEKSRKRASSDSATARQYNSPGRGGNLTIPGILNPKYPKILITVTPAIPAGIPAVSSH